MNRGTHTLPGAFVERPSSIPADSSPAECPICGDPVDASQTAVAVLRGDGSPALVHPACYPQFSAQQRASGNRRYNESPLRDLAPRPESSGSAE
jgi:hypothetical protein